jgi:hypothetical protein
MIRDLLIDDSLLIDEGLNGDLSRDSRLQSLKAIKDQ